ncbi:unnamed protein product [Cuscuta campestris]|uniref:Uncharacterized protein n=1 Tax=Cuscuta campestris TaxID=132261 RepID=A0A484KKZ2_9ASTE|nr:unnamed protein product [Cuscuta campestris]
MSIRTVDLEDLAEEDVNPDLFCSNFAVEEALFSLFAEDFAAGDALLFCSNFAAELLFSLFATEDVNPEHDAGGEFTKYSQVTKTRQHHKASQK